MMQNRLESLFFTSDTHFGDKDTLLRENRPFKDTKSFENSVIKIRNKQATKNDIIYHLGDFFNFNLIDIFSWEE